MVVYINNSLVFLLLVLLYKKQGCVLTLSVDFETAVFMFCSEFTSVVLQSILCGVSTDFLFSFNTAWSQISPKYKP